MDDDDVDEEAEVSSSVSELEDLVPPGLGFRIRTGLPSGCGFRIVVVIVVVVVSTSSVFPLSGRWGDDDDDDDDGCG